MDLMKMGILEIDGERVALRPLELRHEYGENTILKAEIMSIFQESNARSRKKNVIKNVIFNDPATIVIWGDGTKTVVKCQPGDTYDKEKGLALCIAKKYLGNKGNFNEVFKKWIPEDIPKPVKRIDLTPIKPGDRVKIINGGCGAYGANGKTGVVMNPGCYIGYHSGLTDRDLGYYVKTENNQIWRIALNAEIEILKEG